MEVTRRLPFLTNFGQRRPSQLAPSRIRVRAALTGRSRALEGKTTDESTPGGIFEARDQAVVAGDPFIDAPPAHRPGAHALGRGCPGGGARRSHPRECPSGPEAPERHRAAHLPGPSRLHRRPGTPGQGRYRPMPLLFPFRRSIRRAASNADRVPSKSPSARSIAVMDGQAPERDQCRGVVNAGRADAVSWLGDGLERGGGIGQPAELQKLTAAPAIP